MTNRVGQTRWELSAGKNVVAIDITLQKNLSTGVKVEDAAVHAGYVQRQQSALIHQPASKMFRRGFK